MKIEVVGTLDTTCGEVGYLRDSIASFGHTPLVADPGILGQPARAAAGGRAMLQAIEAAVEGASLVEKVRQHP